MSKLILKIKPKVNLVVLVIVLSEAMAKILFRVLPKVRFKVLLKVNHLYCTK